MLEPDKSLFEDEEDLFADEPPAIPVSSSPAPAAATPYPSVPQPTETEDKTPAVVASKDVEPEPASVDEQEDTAAATVDDLIEPTVEVSINDPAPAVSASSHGASASVAPAERIDTKKSASSSQYVSLSGERQAAQEKDLWISISDPEKHEGGMDSYVTYCITTQTSRSQYKDSSFHVRRRYKDFLWLHGRLDEGYPGRIIPPMPEKHVLQHLGRFNPVFLERRRKGLESFLRRCVTHPIISYSDDLRIFLEAPSHELTTARRRAGSILDSWGDSLRNMATKMILKNPDDRFLQMNDYVGTVSEQLAAMDKIMAKLVKEYDDLGNEYADFAPVFSALAESEEGELAAALVDMGSKLEKLSTLYKQVSASQDEKVSIPIREYVLFANAIKLTLKRRDTVQLTCELSMEELDKVRQQKDELESSEGAKMTFGTFMGKDPQVVKQQKMEKLTTQILELEKQVEDTNEANLQVNETIVNDMEHWHQRKQMDFAQIFGGLADSQIECFQEQMAMWEDVLKKIDAIPTTDISAVH